MKIKMNKRFLFFASFSQLFIISFILGIWTKYRQLSLIDSSLTRIYPLSQWAFNIFITLFFLFSIWICSGLIFKFIFGEKILNTLIFLDVLSYWFLILLLFGIQIRAVICIFIISKLLFLSYLFFKKKLNFVLDIYKKQQIIALLIIFLFHLMFNTTISPLSWENPLLNYKPTSIGGVVVVSTSLFRSQYVNAKLFDFSGFDRSYWGTGNYSPTLLYSSIVPVLSFLLDLPSINVIAFHKLIFGIIFLLFVVGSFGFYLFLSKSLKISHEAALIGGIFYTFSNSFFGNISNIEYPSFITPYLFLPYGLLLITSAFRKNKPIYAITAGLTLALPFYYLAPHPEGVIHSVVYLGAYSLWLLFFEKNGVNFLKKFWLCICNALGFLLFSLGYLTPIFYKYLSREIIIFGHQEGEVFNYGFAENYRFLFPMIILAAPFLFWIFQIPKYKQKLKTQRAPIFFFIFVLIISMYIFIPGNDGRLNLWLKFRMPIINFLEEMRSFSYIYISILVLGIFGFDAVLTKKAIHPRKSLLFPFILIVLFLAFIYIFILLTPILWPQIASFDYLLMLTHMDLPYLVNLKTTLFLGGNHLIALIIEIFICSLALLVLYYLLNNESNLNQKISGNYSKLLIHLYSLPKEIFIFLLTIPFVLIHPAYTQYESGQEIENPSTCPYYITMQTLLVNNQGLHNDYANVAFLKNRLLSFEEEFRNVQKSDKNEYFLEYSEILKKEQIETADELENFAIVDFCEKVLLIIDKYFLEKPSCNVSDLYSQGSSSFWRIADYNHASIFSNAKDQNSAILIATESDNSLGIGEGKFIHNSTTSIDARFTSTYPPINSLFLIPGYNFTHIPQYHGFGSFSRPWNLMAGQVLNTTSRHLLDIAGIDYFVIQEQDYLHEFSNAPHWQFEWHSNTLTKDQHSLVIKPVIEQDGTCFALDAISVVTDETHSPQIITFDDTAPEILYSGTWGSINNDVESFQRTLTRTYDPQSEIRFSFEGQNVHIIYPIMPFHAKAQIYIDDEFVTLLDQTQGQNMDWSNLTVIDYQVPPEIDPHFTILKNDNSFGLAYFAKSLQPSNNSLYDSFIAQYDPPFYYMKPDDLAAYLATVNQMRDMLYQVKAKEHVIVDTQHLHKLQNAVGGTSNLGGELLQSNMIGSQAAFQVRCDDQPCFFVFNMANVSGWHAYVDHQPAHIHQTNFAFMGIEVPQGEHLLWFEFAPIYDLGSKTISFLFFCGILGYHFIHQNQVKKQNLDSTHK